jgi:drug/metabolite transporter (DMT)-like permease
VRPDRTALAILLSLVALAMFDVMGLIIKYLSDRFGATELAAWRNIFGLVPSAIALASTRSWHSQGRRIVIRQWPLAAFRGLCITLAQLCFYLSLGMMAFATASTITYANALFMTALAVPLLGEKVGALRWAAVAIGFAGVVAIVRPGADAFTWAGLLPLGAAFFYALSAVTARMLDDDVPTALANLYSTVVAVIGAVILTLATGGFTAVGAGPDIWWIAAMGAVGGIAVLVIVTAYRMTEQSNLAPFSYFGIPLAFLLGWLVFGETPWDALFPGAVLIMAGGLMIVWREGRLKQAARAELERAAR